jgi:ligand-binding sensor domain-containing protein
MRVKTCRGIATAALGILACAPAVGPSGRGSDVFSPDDRVVLSDFSNVEAIAASPWLVFAATTHGLLLYDRLTRKFRAPVTAIDGYPAGRVRRALADAAGNAVWLDVGAGGGYLRYDADGRAWSTGTPSSGQAHATLTVSAALAQAPLADAMRAAILTDRRLRLHEFTAAATTPDRPDIFFGTNGMGMVRVDKQTGEWEVLSYGLLAPTVGAITTAADGGIWAATSARPGFVAPRTGLTWVAGDLSSTRTGEIPFLYSRRLLAQPTALWLATEQGVVRIDPTTFQSRVWTVSDVTALAPAGNGMWIGTARGLAQIDAADNLHELGPGDLAITSLLAVGDTLWAGTNAGLAVLLPGANGLTTPPELAGQASLRVTVHALARLQDTLVMATERELLWRNPATLVWSRVPLPPSLGIPTALAVDHTQQLWIGGTGGLAQAVLSSAFMHVHPVGFDVPAAVRDLATDRDYLWAATDSGLMRIQ